MAEESAEAEPTMEEILASIRRIIAEEDEEPPADEGPKFTLPEDDSEDALGASEPDPMAELTAPEDDEPGDTDEPAASVDDDILELDQPVPEEEAQSDTDDILAQLDDDVEPNLADDIDFVDPEPEPEPEPEPDPVAAEPEPELDASETEPEPEPEPEPQVEAASTPAEETIVSQPVADATAGAFSVLLNNILVASRSQQGLTLDDVVRELLRPMLREWLDANLEGIVKAKVDEEVERITARARM